MLLLGRGCGSGLCSANTVLSRVWHPLEPMSLQPFSIEFDVGLSAGIMVVQTWFREINFPLRAHLVLEESRVLRLGPKLIYWLSCCSALSVDTPTLTGRRRDPAQEIATFVVFTEAR
jgi:hypothetical protein